MKNWIISSLLAVVACVPSVVHAQWYASIDFIAPSRSDSVDTVFQRNQEELLDADGNPTGAFVVGSVSLLTANDLTPDMVSGGRITVGNQGEFLGLEGSYLRTEEWNSSAWVGSVSGDLDARFASPFSPIGATINDTYDDNLSATLCYTTELDSAELHFTYLVCDVPPGTATVLCGVRWVSIDESLDYMTINDIGINEILTTTANQLLGPQVGLLTRSYVPGGFLNINLKFALMSNWIDKETLFNGALGTSTDGAASLLGEFGIEYMFVATPHLSVRIGYQLLAASDIALATGNFEDDVTFLESGCVKIATDNVLYHVPYLGVELTW